MDLYIGSRLILYLRDPGGSDSLQGFICPGGFLSGSIASDGMAGS